MMKGTTILSVLLVAAMATASPLCCCYEPGAVPDPMEESSPATCCQAPQTDPISPSDPQPTSDDCQCRAALADRSSKPEVQMPPPGDSTPAPGLAAVPNSPKPPTTLVQARILIEERPPGSPDEPLHALHCSPIL